MPLLFIGLMVAYIDRLNVSYAKLAMQSDLHLSDAAYGLGAGLFFVGAIIFEVPSNLMLHKVGPRLWLFRIMITWGVISGAMMVAVNETTFLVLRFLLGVAEAGFIPGVALYLTYWFPARLRATVVALFFLAIPLAGIVGGPLAAVFIGPMDGLARLAGWQWMFLLEGLLAIGFSFVLLIRLTPGPTAAKWLSDPEKAEILRNLAQEDSAPDVPLRRAMRDRRILLLAAIYAFMVMGTQGIIYWSPQLISNSGVRSPAQAAILSAIPFLLYIPLSMLVTWSSDRTGDRKRHLLGVLLVSTAGWLVTLNFPSVTTVALAGLALANLGGIAAPLLLALPTKIARGAGLAAAIAFLHALGNVGAAVSPAVFGILSDVTGDTATSVLILVASTVVAALLVAFIPKELASDNEPRSPRARNATSWDDPPGPRSRASMPGE